MISQIVTGSDAGARVLWDLPAVPDSVVAFAADSAACSAAATAHEQAVNGDPADPQPVFVIRVGATRYVVFNYTSVGEYFFYAVFDASWNVLRRIAG